MRCVREMGMRVLTVHLRIYINCTVDGRLSSELHCSILHFHNILFLSSLSSVAHCITVTLQMKGLRKHCRRCLGIFLGAICLGQMRATRLYVLIRARISGMSMRAELYSGLMSTI